MTQDNSESLEGRLDIEDQDPHIWELDGRRFTELDIRIPCTTHNILVIKDEDGELLVLKYGNTNGHGNLKAEVYNGITLNDVPGVAPVLYSGGFAYNAPSSHGYPEEMTYIIKPYYSGSMVSDADITPEMREMALETMKGVHMKGLSLEIEMKANDWVLDEEGRPILVDLEIMGRYNKKVPMKVRKRDEYNLRKIFNSDSAVETLQLAKVQAERFGLTVWKPALYTTLLLGGGATALMGAGEIVANALNHEEVSAMSHIKLYGGMLSAFAGSFPLILSACKDYCNITKR